MSSPVPKANPPQPTWAQKTECTPQKQRVLTLARIKSHLLCNTSPDFPTLLEATHHNS